MTDGTSASNGVGGDAPAASTIRRSPSPVRQPPAVVDIGLGVENTTISFAVRWLGVLTVRGRFAELEGALRIPDGRVDEAQLTLDVAAASVRTGIALRDRHLRGPQFLDAGRFPRITFRSTWVGRPKGVLVVSGVISLKGSEREVTAECPVDYAGSDGQRSHLRLNAAIEVPRLPHRIGVAEGIERLNPLLYAIGSDVAVQVEITVPATSLLPSLLPALAR
jgi:polyisoprenoid-binding protein YceI